MQHDFKAVMTAAWRKDWPVVDAALDAGFDINADLGIVPGTTSNDPAHLLLALAVHDGVLPLVRKLLARDGISHSALIYAVEQGLFFGRCGCLAAVLQYPGMAGVEPHALLRRMVGSTPVDALRTLFQARAPGPGDAAPPLVVYNVLKTAPLRPYGDIILDRLGRAGNLSALQLLLHEDAKLDATRTSADMDKKRRVLEALVRTAASVGHVHVVEYLLDATAASDVDAFGVPPGAKRCTALMLAAKYGHGPCVARLLARGAKPNLKDKVSGRTPLHMTSFHHLQGHKYDAHRPAIVDALVAHGAKVNARDKRGQTPLMAAVACGNLLVVRALLNQPATDLTLVDKTGRTAANVWSADALNYRYATLYSDGDFRKARDEVRTCVWKQGKRWSPLRAAWVGAVGAAGADAAAAAAAARASGKRQRQSK